MITDVGCDVGRLRARRRTDFSSNFSFGIGNLKSKNEKVEGFSAVNRLRRHFSDPIIYHSSSNTSLDWEGSVRSINESGENFTNVGQSWDEVKQFLIESRINDLEISRDIERLWYIGRDLQENLHMYLSEILIAAFEQIEWRSVTESCPQDKLHIKNASCPSLDDTTKECSTSERLSSGQKTGLSTFFTPGDQPIVEKPDVRDQQKIENESQSEEPNSDDNSAEAIAASLIKHFSTSNRLRNIDDMRWLVSYAEAPQKLLPMPSDIALHIEELDRYGKPICFRGTEKWAQPRKQWIFALHTSSLSVRKMLEKQNYRCSGCGIKVEKIYVRRMRYCDYYGKLFCQKCHQGSKAYIPARVLYHWDFKEYAVSDIAHRFLLDNFNQPVIDMSAFDIRLYKRERKLKQIRKMRVKIVHIWSYVRFCSIAKNTITKFGNLYEMFSLIPSYMLNDTEVYSMSDLVNVNHGELIRRIAPIVQFGQYHIEGCEYCRAKAFFCELCDRRNDLLFPFQVDKVERCEECGSLSHIDCAIKWRKEEKSCPKCVRIKRNMERHRRTSENSTLQAENDRRTL